MIIRKLIQKRLRHQRDGASLASDVNVVVAANIGEGKASGAPTSKRHEPGRKTEVQRKTEVSKGGAND
jgi:hypothetical protein